MSSLLGMEDAMRFLKNTREYLTPVLTESQFLSKGMLTPEEFVIAGDHLIRTSPSWSWESGEPSKIRPYLPPNKQYLVTRGVPSFRRISALEVDSFIDENIFLNQEEEGAGGGKEGGEEGGGETKKVEEEWFYTHSGNTTSSSSAPPAAAASSQQQAPPAPTSSSNKEEEYLDMEDESLTLDEVTQGISHLKASGSGEATPGNDNLLKVRRYDVSLTYDNYYRTPRVWLFGYDENNGSPLEPTAIFEDVMTDYAKRTVTIDPHPHLSKPHGKILSHSLDPFLIVLPHSPPPLPLFFSFSSFYPPLSSRSGYDKHHFSSDGVWHHPYSGAISANLPQVYSVCGADYRIRLHR